MDEITKEVSNRKEPTRFILKGGKSPHLLVKGFEMMNELNKIEQPYEKDGKMKIIKHRVGLTTNCQLIIDIDNHDLIHENRIVKRLIELFPSDWIFVKPSWCWKKEFYFEVRTLNGYQIISKVKEKSSFEYKNLKVLNFKLEREYYAIYQFKEKLIKYLEDFRRANPNPSKGLFNEQLKVSGLINPVGEFDYLYNVLGIVNGHYSIRLTPKIERDKWVIIP